MPWPGHAAAVATLIAPAVASSGAADSRDVSAL